VRKFMSIGLTVLVTLSVLLCLALAASLDGVGPS
jgi:hypothetical protein